MGRSLQARSRSRTESRVRVLKALAHPTRLFIVEELAEGERCVCELTEMIGDDISTVSKHLSLLRDAGILASERRGPQVFYRLRVPCVLDVFDCIEGVLGTRGRRRCGNVSGNRSS